MTSVAFQTPEKEQTGTTSEKEQEYEDLLPRKGPLGSNVNRARLHTLANEDRPGNSNSALLVAPGGPRRSRGASTMSPGASVLDVSTMSTMSPGSTMRMSPGSTMMADLTTGLSVAQVRSREDTVACLELPGPKSGKMTPLQTAVATNSTMSDDDDEECAGRACSLSGADDTDASVSDVLEEDAATQPSFTNVATVTWRNQGSEGDCVSHVRSMQTETVFTPAYDRSPSTASRNKPSGKKVKRRSTQDTSGSFPTMSATSTLQVPTTPPTSSTRRKEKVHIGDRVRVRGTGRIGLVISEHSIGLPSIGLVTCEVEFDDGADPRTESFGRESLVRELDDEEIRKCFEQTSDPQAQEHPAEEANTSQALVEPPGFVERYFSLLLGTVGGMCVGAT